MPAQAQPPIEFTIEVTNKDWEASKRGWRCPALRIPGARVDEVLVKGLTADKGLYDVRPGFGMVRWPNLPQPKQAVICISLNVNEILSTQELTKVWKILAIILPPIAVVLGALIGGSFNLASKTQAIIPREHIVFNLSTPAFGRCGEIQIDGFIGMPTGSQETITRKFLNWGDGSSGDSSFPALHRYAQNGSYSVTVKAYASNNTTEDQTIPVNITNADDTGCR